jgi:hypothetical protein
VTVHLNKFLYNKTRCTNFTNLFWHEILHVSDSSSVHHQELIHCTLSNGVCHTSCYTAFEQHPAGPAVPSRPCSKAVYKPVWHIPLRSVQWINSWWWTDELSGTCGVSWQNKFVKLVHLVGLLQRNVFGTKVKVKFLVFKLKKKRFLFVLKSVHLLGLWSVTDGTCVTCLNHGFNLLAPEFDI